MANAKNDATKNATLGFEAELWKTAEKMWGHIPAAEYRQILIGLIFLRYVSATFKAHQAQRGANNFAVYGQEANHDTWRMAKMNLAIRGITCDLGPSADDTFRNGTFENETGFAAAVTTDEIASKDFNLVPGRYVGIVEDEGDGEPFCRENGASHGRTHGADGRVQRARCKDHRGAQGGGEVSEWGVGGEVMRRETSDASGGEGMRRETRDVRLRETLDARREGRVSCLASPVTSRLASRVSCNLTSRVSRLATSPLAERGLS